ncbi:MAG: hypothetical protein IJW70_00150 [Clostridia bacterium]|nr:hypothetical protein [Clostridia bacterium]
MYTEDKKRIMCQSDCIQDHKRLAIHEVAIYGFLLLLAVVTFGGRGTGMMVVAFTETGGFAVLIAVFVTAALLFYAIVITGAVFVIRYLSPSIALLCDKYTLELDRAKFSTPKEHYSRHSHSHYIMYQTEFEKFGKYELGEPPRMEQEFYVLATTAKKPRIIAVYDKDKYEITQR